MEGEKGWELGESLVAIISRVEILERFFLSDASRGAKFWSDKKNIDWLKKQVSNWLPVFTDRELTDAHLERVLEFLLCDYIGAMVAMSEGEGNNAMGIGIAFIQRMKHLKEIKAMRWDDGQELGDEN